MRITKKAVAEMLKADYKLLYQPMPPEVKEMFPVLSMSLSNELNGIHVTTEHRGKMAGNYSISGSVKCESCQAKIRFAMERTGGKSVKEAMKENPLRTDIPICGGCYSDRQVDYQPPMQPVLMRNEMILNNGIIHEDWIPLFNALYERGQAFGDTNSRNAAMNQIRFAEFNPGTRVGQWGKNLGWFIQLFEDGVRKPKNLQLVYSSMYINRKSPIPARWKPYVDRRFTVYTPEYAKLHGIQINCGARACMKCLNCYEERNIFDIAELLK